jgi:hypothetical protein
MIPAAGAQAFAWQIAGVGEHPMFQIARFCL